MMMMMMTTMYLFGCLGSPRISNTCATGWRQNVFVYVVLNDNDNDDNSDDDDDDNVYNFVVCLFVCLE